MQTYELLVKGRAVKANSADTTLVRTSIGIDKIHVLFDNDEWLDFALSVTFAQGTGSNQSKVTTSITPSLITGSSDWVAEAECLVPWEVIDMTGPIRVTFQGTDASGNHIITAAGAPLFVEEAGDVDEGLLPQENPSVSEWEQAYADAMAAASAALSAAAEAQAAITAMQNSQPIATTESLGSVIVDGDTIEVDSNGVISAVEQYELPIASTQQLGGISPDGETIEVDGLGTASVSDSLMFIIANIQRLASGAFDSTFDANNELTGAIVKSSSLPLPTDLAKGCVKIGTNLTMASDGTVSAIQSHRGTSSTASSTATKAVTCSDFALSTGSVIAVTFSNAQTDAAAVKLNVNSTGEKSAYVNNAAASSSNPLTWAANETLTFIYDGTQYRLIARDGAATGGSGGSGGVSIYRGTSSTAGSTATKAVTCSGFELQTGAVIAVTFANGNPTRQQLKLNVNSTGDKLIYVNSSGTSFSNSLLWENGETLTFMYDGTEYILLARDEAWSPKADDCLGEGLVYVNGVVGVKYGNSLRTDYYDDLVVNWEDINNFWGDVFGAMSGYGGLYWDQQGETGLYLNVPYAAYHLSSTEEYDETAGDYVRKSYGLTPIWTEYGSIEDASGLWQENYACLGVNVDNSTIKINAQGQLYVDVAAVKAAIDAL